MDLVRKVEEIIRRLRKLYPNPKLELEFENPFQLLIMAILAAQESDKKVNKTASDLFVDLKDPQHFVEIEVEISSAPLLLTASIKALPHSSGSL